MRKIWDRKEAFVSLTSLGDGQAERTVENTKQTLRRVLAAREVDKTIWPHILQEVAYGLNSLESSSSKFTPQELMFGSRIRSPIDQIVGAGESVSRGNPRIEEHKEWSWAAENMERARAQTKRQYDKSALGSTTAICVGQTTLLRNFNRADGLEPMFTGPYTVLDIKYPNVKVQKGENRYTWVHLNDCKIVQQPAPVNLWAQGEPKQAGERAEDESNIEEPIVISMDTEVEGQEDPRDPHRPAIANYGGRPVHANNRTDMEHQPTHRNSNRFFSRMEVM